MDFDEGAMSGGILVLLVWRFGGIHAVPSLAYRYILGFALICPIRTIGKRL
jgi:hypothetical protein